MANQKTREPLLHIAKRGVVPLKNAILIRVAAILLSLIFCGIITIFLTGDNPISIYVTIFEGALDENVPRDEEAFNAWSKHIDPARIINGNKHDNFWEMGDT